MKKLLSTLIFLLVCMIPSHLLYAERTMNTGCLSVDIVLLVDRSYSQSPFQNETLYAIQNVLFELPVNNTDVRVGIISFADSATLHSSITGDSEYLRLVFDSLSELPIESHGTYIEQSILMTPALFAQSAMTRKHNAARVIIILSNGEITGWEFALPKLRYLEKYYSVRIYTVGIGNDDMSDYVLRKMATDSSYFGGTDIEQVIEKIQKLKCP